MCEGALLPKMFRFAIPLYLAHLLQLLFHAADLVVIGRYASAQSLAAIGSTSALALFSLNLFIGLSVGANVLAANFFGAKDSENLERTTHTAMLISIIGGIAIAIAGCVFARPMLIWMGSPGEVLEKSTLYLKIYYAGIPSLLIYNFGSAVLRAIGDTRRPLYYMIIAGIINVVLNLIFVLVFKLDVAGVAWATIISQTVSAALVWYALATADDACKLVFKKLRIVPHILRRMVAIGVPAGAQGACFSISNILIQSSINSFGELAMAGNGATLSLEHIVYTGSYTMHYVVLSFVGQNYGGKQFTRVMGTMWHGLWMACVICTLGGSLFFIFGEQLLSFYNDTPEAIDWGLRRMKISFTPYALCGTMDVLSAVLRALGKSSTAAIVSLVGVCVLRALWIFFVLPYDRTMETLMLSYPISWALTSIAMAIYLVPFLKRKKLELQIR